MGEALGDRSWEDNIWIHALGDQDKTRLFCSTGICNITFSQTIPFHNLHIHGLSPSHALSPNLSLNSAATAALTQPPDPSQLPSPLSFPSKTSSPTPLSPTSIPLRCCQNSHRLLPNCREENHPLRCPMSFHSNLLSTSMDSFPKPDSSNPNQRRRETTVCEAWNDELHGYKLNYL